MPEKARPGFFQCTVAARERGEPVMATASQVSSWLLIEVDGPWGKDAIGHSELGPFAPAVWRAAMKRRGIRVIAVRRNLTDRHHGHSGELRLVHIAATRPGGPQPLAWRRVIESLHDVVAATESLTARDGVTPEWTVDPDRYVLVCTNGRHDPCCATFGRPLVRALRQSKWSEEVWECSHIGGDRFAGNVVLLPDSLYFGHCDESDALRVLAAHDEGRLELESFRGRSTYRSAEQAAEHFVRLERRLDSLDAVVGMDTFDEGRYRVAVDEGGRPTAYDVTIERVTVPSPTPLTCKGEDGMRYSRFRLVDLTPV